MTSAVSVVMATHNYGQFLAEALDSALAQTFRDFDLIIIDDGSTDGTDEIVAPYLSHPQVRYVRTDHVGQPAAKNMGIRLTQAPLVAFLDADDVWMPNKLEQQVTLLTQNPTVGVVYSRRLLIDEHGRNLEYKQPVLRRGNILPFIFRDNFVCFSSAVVRRQVFTDVGLFDTTLALSIDFDLWLRVALKHEFDFVDAPLVKYRTGHASLSQRTEERLATVNLIVSRFLDKYGGRSALAPSVIRIARAETSFHAALAKRTRSRLAALPLYLHCLILCPMHASAWKGLFALLLPESWLRRIRVALGRPADWSRRQPIVLESPNLVLTQGGNVVSCQPPG
jgi:glycosyltransferase involved in cell wall biosynthesis